MEKLIVLTWDMNVCRDVCFPVICAGGRETIALELSDRV